MVEVPTSRDQYLLLLVIPVVAPIGAEEDNMHWKNDGQ
jgi:hypothetical protein